MSHLELGPDHKEMKSTSSSSPPPHSGEAHITPSHPSSTSSSKSKTGDDTNTMKTKRILEYNLKPMVTATAAAAANDNVEAGGGGANSSGCATAGSGEAIEIMTRGDAGLTLISSPPAHNPSSSPARESKLDNKLTKDDSGGESQKSGTGKVCFFSGQTIGKGGSYYFAANVLPSSADEDEDKDKEQKRSQLYTLSSSMKLMGYPTICDDDIRRMDTLYFAQTCRRLPEELRLSSNWTRVAKHCSFSGRPIPDGVPFFYARRKTVDENGRSILGRFCYLRADVVCAKSTVDVREEVKYSNRNSDRRPLGPQDLMHLLTEYPEVCDSLPSNILEDPAEWSLLDKFCFFSGAPIKADDMCYRASLGGKDIYLLVVLSPAVTARELFQLETKRPQGRGIGRQLLEELRKELVPLNVKEVEGMDRVYDLSLADFDSLRERHYGSYQKLPRRLTDPSEDLSWEKVVPPSFLAAKEEAMRRAVEYEKNQLDDSLLPASVPTDVSLLSTAGPVGDACALFGVTCGAPESFTLKDLIQDDDSYFRELVQADSIIRGSRDDESIGTASLDNLKATLQRYSSRVGGQSVLSSDTRFAGELFDEFSYADDATFYTYVTETTAGFGDQHKNYKPDLGN